MKKRLYLFAAILIVFAIAGYIHYSVPVISNSTTATSTNPHIQSGTSSTHEITQQKAIEVVTAKSEIQIWIKTVMKNGGDPHVASSDQIQTDSNEKKYWLIQTYESLATHNATHEWYRVYVENGLVVLDEGQ